MKKLNLQNGKRFREMPGLKQDEPGENRPRKKELSVGSEM